MNYFKIIFFTVILHPSSLSANLESVMNVVDRGEDFFLDISQKFKNFLCGTKDRKMDTDIGRGINILLCEDISIDGDSIDPLSEEISTAFFDRKIPRGMNFVIIRPKKFKMGSPKREKNREDNEDGVKVRITKPFEITDTEVTQAQWFDVMNDNPSFFKQQKYCSYEYRVESTKYGNVELCPNHPVESVSWDMIQVFIRRMNKNRDDAKRHPLKLPVVIDFLQKQSGNLLQGEGQKRRTFLGTILICSIFTLGIGITHLNKPIEWVKNLPIFSAFTMSMAMCGNGCRTLIQ